MDNGSEGSTDLVFRLKDIAFCIQGLDFGFEKSSLVFGEQEPLTERRDSCSLIYITMGRDKSPTCPRVRQAPDELFSDPLPISRTVVKDVGVSPTRPVLPITTPSIILLPRRAWLQMRWSPGGCILL